MALLHMSVNAGDPQRMANFLAGLLGGNAMPFQPFPDAWIAFSERNDGTAIEVYPLTHRLTVGDRQVHGATDATPDRDSTFVHAAIGSPLPGDRILERAATESWMARTCNRGPFECVEIWLENRLLIKVLDPDMQQDHRRGMSQQNWRAMFNLD